MKKIILFLYLIISLTNQAQTNVTGNIFSNTTWTQLNSPYIIKNDIIIYQGATLTVQSGVEIKIDNGFKIDLRGNLTLSGSASDSIFIHSSDINPTKTSWYGIKFNALGKIKMDRVIF